MFKTAMDKVLIGFTVVLAIFMAFSTGVNTQAGQWLNALSAGISGAFFIAIVWAVVAGRIASLKAEVRHKMFKEIEPMIDGLVKAAADIVETAKANEAKPVDATEAEHERALTDALMHAVKDVLGEPREIAKADIPAIQKRFTEITGDHHVKIELEEDGMAAEFLRIGARIPVGRVEGEDPQPVATHTAPDAAPLSKSQQRRINSQKGLGALTDAEVKEARNEKRRAARAAKKAGSVQVTNNPNTTNEVEPTLKEKIAQQS